MAIMSPNRIIIAAGIALSLLALWRGYEWGYSSAEALRNAELLARIEAGKKLEAERLQIAAERDDLSRKLEDAEYAAPVFIERCLSPDRVRRLNALR